MWALARDVPRQATKEFIAGVEARCADAAACRPAGFILHESRCGSTLMSNMLAGVQGGNAMGPNMRKYASRSVFASDMDGLNVHPQERMTQMRR